MTEALLEKLLTLGVQLSVQGDRLNVRAKKGSLTPEDRQWLADHKAEIIRTVEARKVHLFKDTQNDTEGDLPPGKRLLHALWDAGFGVELRPGPTLPTGWVLFPVGPGATSPELFDLYDRHHDEAVTELLETCRLAKIPPESWPEAARALLDKSSPT